MFVSLYETLYIINVVVKVETCFFSVEESNSFPIIV